MIGRRSRWLSTAGALGVLLLACNCSPKKGTQDSKTGPPVTPPPARAEPPPLLVRPAPPAKIKDCGPVVRGLCLQLRADKTRYAAKEPLKLHAVLRNVGTKPLIVLNRAEHVDAGLNGKNHKGQFLCGPLPPPSPPPPAKKKDLTTLAPGGRLELKDWEWLIMVNRQIVQGKGHTGRFNVSAFYRVGYGSISNMTKLNKDAWTGRLKSNEVEIRIGK